MSLIEKLSEVESYIPINSIVNVKGQDEKRYIVVSFTKLHDKVVYHLTSMDDASPQLHVLEKDMKIIKLSGVEQLVPKNEIPNEDDGYSVNDRLDYIETALRTLQSSLQTEYKLIYKNKNPRPEKTSPNNYIKITIEKATIDGYVHGVFVLAGDIYLRVLDRVGEVTIISRDILLKPFIKRIFNTFLYGRNHISNFVVMETVDESHLRFIKTINEFISQVKKHDEFSAILLTGECADLCYR